jgi:hypothetical protein
MDYRLYKPEIKKTEVKKVIKTQSKQQTKAKKQQSQSVKEQSKWEKFKAWVKSFKK